MSTLDTQTDPTLDVLRKARAKTQPQTPTLDVLRQVKAQAPTAPAAPAAVPFKTDRQRFEESMRAHGFAIAGDEPDLSQAPAHNTLPAAADAPTMPEPTVGPRPEPGFFQNIATGAARGWAEQAPKAFGGNKDAATRMAPAEGVGGFIGETAAGLPAGIINPEQAAVNVVGAVTGAKGVQVATPLLKRVATAAGPRVAGVLSHMIGGSAGTAPIGAMQRAGQITHEQWAQDPIGSLWQVFKAGAGAAAVGGVVGAGTGAVTGAKYTAPDPSVRPATIPETLGYGIAEPEATKGMIREGHEAAQSYQQAMDRGRVQAEPQGPRAPLDAQRTPSQAETDALLRLEQFAQQKEAELSTAQTSPKSEAQTLREKIDARPDYQPFGVSEELAGPPRPTTGALALEWIKRKREEARERVATQTTDNFADNPRSIPENKPIEPNERLSGTALRNIRTGEIISGGDKTHGLLVPNGKYASDYDAGFVTDKGRFVDRATAMKMLGKDVDPENGPDLYHTGLRMAKAGEFGPEAQRATTPIAEERPVAQRPVAHAIKTTDGRILSSKNVKAHFQVADEHAVSYDDVADSGWIMPDGRFESNSGFYKPSAETQKHFNDQIAQKSPKDQPSTQDGGATPKVAEPQAFKTAADFDASADGPDAMGGISSLVAKRGLKPAFRDTETGKVYPSQYPPNYANKGDPARPAPIHVPDGLPPEVVLEWSRAEDAYPWEAPVAEKIKATVEAGFVDESGRFQTRKEVAPPKQEPRHVPQPEEAARQEVPPLRRQEPQEQANGPAQAQRGKPAEGQRVPEEAADVLKPEKLPTTWYRGAREGQDTSAGTFYSASKESADAFGKVGKGEKITPKNPLVFDDKQAAADALGLGVEDVLATDNATHAKVDQAIAEHAKSKGHDAVVYRSGSFDAPELHLLPTEQPKPAAKQPTGKPMSKSAIEKMLVDRHEQMTGPQEGEGGEPTPRTFYHKDAPGSLGENGKMTAKQIHALLPSEIRETLTPQEAREAGFQVTNRKGEAHGEAAAYDMGWGEYIDSARGGNAAKVEKAKSTFRSAKDMDPEAAFFSALHDHLGGNKRAYSKSGMVDPAKLKAGDTFKVGGVDVRVVNEGTGENSYLVLKDGGDLPDTPLGALEKVPVDKGTLGGPKNTAEAKAKIQETRDGTQEVRGEGAAGIQGRTQEVGRSGIADRVDGRELQPEQKRRDASRKSAEFDKWFGDSKVADENGAPKRLYHGTRSDFELSELKTPAYFSDKPTATYAGGEGGRTIPVYVRMVNPKEYGGPPMTVKWSEVQQAIKEGHDGFIQRSKYRTDYIIFDKDQVRSAIEHEPVRNSEQARQRIKEKRNAAERLPERSSGATDTGDAAPNRGIEKPAEELRGNVRPESTGKAEDVQPPRDAGNPADKAGLERPPDEPNTIGLNKAEIRRAREEYGLHDLGKPEVHRHVKAMEEAQEKGYVRNAVALAKSAIENNTIIDDTLHGGMAVKLAELANTFDEITVRMADANKAKDDTAYAIARAERQQVLADIDTLTVASERSGTEAARTMNFRKRMIDRDSMKLSNMIVEAREAKGGKLPNDKEIERLRGVERLYTKLTERMKDVEKRDARLAAENAKLRAGEIVRRAAIRKQAASVSEVIRQKNAIKINDILSDLRKIGVRTNEITSAGAEGLYHVGRLALEMARQGIGNGKLDEIIKAVQEKVPEATPEEIRTAINMRDPSRQKALRSDAEKRVADLKKQAAHFDRLQRLSETAEAKATGPGRGEAKAQAKAEKAEAKRKDRVDTGQMRLVLDQIDMSMRKTIADGKRLEKAQAKVADLKAQLKDGFRNLKNPEKEIPEGLAAIREQLKDLRKTIDAEDTLADLKGQLESGDFKIKDPKEITPISPEMERLQADIKKARAEKVRIIDEMRPWNGARVVGEVVNTMRTLWTTGDTSAVGRQGAVIGSRMPVQAAKFYKTAVEGMLSGERAEITDLRIRAKERELGADLAGLDLSDFDGTSNKHEELFRSNTIERLARAKWYKAPVVKQMAQAAKASERHMTLYLNLLRLEAFERFKDAHPNATPAELRAIAEAINVSTGRSKWARGLGTFGKAFLAPGFTASRFQYPTLAFKYSKSGSWLLKKMGSKEAQYLPRIRNDILKTYATYLAPRFGLLALAAAAGFEVNVTDPRDADWLKIKIGNHRLDLFSGFAQPARLVSRLGMTVTDATGLTAPPSHIAKSGPNKGTVIPDTQQPTPQSLIEQFAEYRLNPALSTGLALVTGKTATGQPQSRAQTLANIPQPLTLQSIFEAYQNATPSYEELTALGTLFEGIIGLGGQTYKDSEAKTRRKIDDLNKAGETSDAARLRKAWNDDPANKDNQIAAPRD